MKFTTLTSLVVAALAPILLAAEDASKNTVILSPQGVKNLGITFEKAQSTNFETTVFAIGRIKPIPNRHAVISTRFSGRVVQTPPIVGDIVKKGQVLLRVESRQPGSPPPIIDLKAPEGGVIAESHVTLGQPVDPSQELMDIVDLKQVWAVANVPESQASKIKIGSKAHIKVISFGDKQFTGELIRMGTEANPEAGTVEAIFLLDNPDMKMRPNMRTEFSIVTSTREKIVSVPRLAVQGDAAEPYVFVKDFDLPNAFVKCPVIVGERNDRFVEIKSGITRYDEVVTNGAYFLGFAGEGSVSLKDALDAAHGHEHAADGSELTDDQKSASTGSSADGESSSNFSSPIVIFLIASNVITLILLSVVTIRKSK